MVVGNGLLARTFAHLRQHEALIVFASGVSNSQERGSDAFEREIKLLGEHLILRQRIVYFSTVSVYDPDLRHSPYIIHKKRAENIIASSGVPFLIFRLPILVGYSDNPNTLTNFLYHRIIHGETIPVFTKACRYLMDAEDTGTLLTEFIQQEDIENQIIDVNFNNAINIEQLISIFSTVTGIKASMEFLEKGGCYNTNNALFLELVKQHGFTLPENYNELVIRKYYAGK